MAGATGLEPAASCVTGRRYNQLNYAPAFKFREYKMWKDQRQDKREYDLRKIVTEIAKSSAANRRRAN